MSKTNPFPIRVWKKNKLPRFNYKRAFIIEVDKRRRLVISTTNVGEQNYCVLTLILTIFATVS